MKIKTERQALVMGMALYITASTKEQEEKISFIYNDCFLKTKDFNEDQVIVLKREVLNMVDYLEKQ